MISGRKAGTGSGAGRLVQDQGIEGRYIIRVRKVSTGSGEGRCRIRGRKAGTGSYLSHTEANVLFHQKFL